MRRRHFITVLGGAAAWPVAARAQQSQQVGKLPSIGVLGAATPATWSPWTSAFEKRLAELGWIEGRTITIEYRWAEGRPERYAEIAADFVRLKVDAIVTGGPATSAAKQATAVIPIVFALAPDPVGSGLVASLARPGGNITGLSIQQAGTSSKRLELLRDIVPGLHRIAIIFNAANPQTVTEMGEVQAVARTLGLEITPLEIRRAEDIAPVFATLKAQADALYVVGDPIVAADVTSITTLAFGSRLPTIFPTRDFAQAGGLVSYGPSFPDLFRRAAEMIDKILRGTKPGDIPVEQPTKFDLVINLTTAKALGLEIPHNLLVLADEVIE
jgi:putative ABC transport system substrate-binding protein